MSAQSSFHLPYLLLFVSSAGSALLGLVASQFQAPEPGIVSIGLAIILAGTVIGLWGRGTLSRYKTAVSPYGEPTALVTSGPFARSRNPMYVSYVLVALGGAVAFLSFLSFLPPILYFIYLDTIVIPREELALALHFPQEFRAYASRVSRWI